MEEDGLFHRNTKRPVAKCQVSLEIVTELMVQGLLIARHCKFFEGIFG